MVAADEISLLPDVETPFELAQSETDAARWPLPTHLIKDVWNPTTCPLDLLPHLAAGLGLEIWDDAWSEDRKRSIVAGIWRLKRNKTKLKGIAAYLDLVGSTLVSAKRPRDKRWWSGGQSAEQKAATLAVMPKIRIYPFASPAPAPRGKAFWSGRAVKQFWRAGRCWVPSDAAERYAKRAVYIDPRVGVAEPVTLRGIDGALDASILVSLAAPASIAKAFWGAKTTPRFWGHQAWMASDAADHVLAITPTPAATTFAVPMGVEPIAIRPTRVAEPVPVRPGMMFWGRGHYRRPNPNIANSVAISCAWRASDAADHVYDEIALFDPARQVATRMPYSFWGYSRWGRPAYTAELRVDCPTPRPLHSMQWGRPWGRRAVWRKADPTPFWNMVAAVNTAKAFRDTVWITTKLYEPISFSPGLRFGGAGFARFGDQRKLP